MSNQANADITYIITGFANNIPGDLGPLSGEVGINEAFTAVFQINNSALDFNSTEGSGIYPGSITSSSITFAGDYESSVDFTGGDVIVSQDNAGGGINLVSPGGMGSVMLVSSGLFDFDPLLTLPGSSWSLAEPDGLIVSSTRMEIGELSSQSRNLVATNVTIVSTATAVPEPSAMGLLGLGLVVASLGRRKS